MSFNRLAYIRDWKRQHRGYTPTARPCLICGQPFIAKKRRDTVCSSEACRRRRYLSYQLQYHRSDRGYAPTEQPCAMCGNRFVAKKRIDKTCSPRCHHAFGNLKRALKTCPDGVPPAIMPLAI